MKVIVPEQTGCMRGTAARSRRASRLSWNGCKDVLGVRKSARLGSRRISQSLTLASRLHNLHLPETLDYLVALLPLSSSSCLHPRVQSKTSTTQYREANTQTSASEDHLRGSFIRASRLTQAQYREANTQTSASEDHLPRLFHSCISPYPSPIP